jgi:hypothetical protein
LASDSPTARLNVEKTGVTTLLHHPLHEPIKLL